MRLAIFGGMFDPPHIAHLIHAQHAADQLDARVLFMPVGDPPHKQGAIRTSAQHRVAMVELAIAGNPAFELTRVDLDRPGPHYTVDALVLLAERYPGVDLTLLIGADSLRDLPRWREPLTILERASLAVFPRPEVELSTDALESLLPGLRERVTWIDSPLLDVSSSDVARRVRSGSVRYLVPDAVLAYLEANKLYAAE